MLTRAVIALLLAGALLVAAPASSVAAVPGSVSVSVNNVDQLTWDCPCEDATVSFTVAAPDPYQFVYYKYVVEVQAPNGYRRSWSGQEYYGGSWQWQVILLPGVDEYGTYAVTATVDYYGAAGNVPIDTKTAASSFTFSGPPAPPEPEPYTTQIKGKVFSATYHRRLRWFHTTIQSEYRSPREAEIGLPARFQLLVGAKVVASRKLTWSKTSSLTKTLPRAKRTKRYRVRVKINGRVVLNRVYTVKGTRR